MAERLQAAADRQAPSGVPACLRCGTAVVPLQVLARRGSLVSVCTPCFYVEEISRLLLETESANVRTAAVLSLEEVFLFLKRECERDTRARDAESR